MRQAFGVALLILSVASPSWGQTELAESVVSAGGTEMAGSHQLRGTVAQTATGRTVGLNYELSMGYWRSYGETVSAVTPPAAHVWGFHGNYPNPFNPMTIVSFTLPEAGPAKLRIFNLRGEQVRILADGNFAAGAQQVVWNGRDATGGEVASGVYFARLESNHGVLTRKMTLTR